MTSVGWMLLTCALAALVIGLVMYRQGRRHEDGLAAAIVSFIVGADLLVFAVGAVLV